MYGPLEILILSFYGLALWASAGRGLALTEILPPIIKVYNVFSETLMERCVLRLRIQGMLER